MKTRSFLAGAVIATALSGCQVDPFPAEGTIRQDKPVERPVAKPWGIDVPERLEFEEGRLGEYRVMAHVPAPATPILAMADLPAGVSFDSETGVISWEPDFAAGNDPRDPTADSRSYVARVLLSSSEEPQSVIEKIVTLVVSNTPRDVELQWDVSDFEMTEGEAFRANVEILSEDYPQGPFQFFMTGLPSGVQVDGDSRSASRFKVGFTPGLNMVGRNDSFLGGRFYKNWQAQAVVVDPSGRQTVTPIHWKVIDARQNPVISAPSSVQQLDDIRLQIVSQDPNLETAPLVNVVRPAFGTLDVDHDDEGFTTLTSIRWHGIPEDQIGTTHSLQIRACVYGSSWQKNRCETRSIEVKIEARPLSEPEIDRRQWTLGKIQYLREGERFRIRLPIRNPNSGGSSSYSVSIEPESLRSEVEYRSGDLIVTPSSAGFRQFNVKVRIPQGLTRSESFSFEALPRSWSRVLVLGDGLRDPEVRGTLALVPGAQVVNPLMQELNERTLSHRGAVILGTSLLSDPQALEAAIPAIDSVRVVMIQSPLVDRMGSELWTRLGAIGLNLQGRIQEVLGVNFPGLARLPVRPGHNSGLSSPVSSLVVSGGLTSESVNPVLLAANSSSCRALLNFHYAPVPSLPPYELPAAVRCDLTGKRWIVSGVEWADLVAQSPEDQSMVSTWMREVLE